MLWRYRQDDIMSAERRSEENAAVALAAPVLLAFNAVNNLFGVGSSSMMSRALGRRDYDTVYRSSAFGFYCCIICSIIFSIICTVGKNPLLGLLGADARTAASTAEYLKWTVTFGAAGAGLATFLSNCVVCLYFFILLYRKRGNTYVCIRASMFRFKKDIVLGVFGVGIPASIQNLLNVTGMTVLNNFTSSYGPDAVAAMGITQKINMVPMQISMRLSQGIMLLISYSYSSRNIRRMKEMLRFVIKISMGFVVTVSAGYLLFCEKLCWKFRRCLY